MKDKWDYSRKSYTIADYYLSYKDYVESDSIYDVPYDLMRHSNL